ncbi:EamA family transporter [Candidatus Peregrinibacteria bacterium]|nr:EamA family transporter [Candidatus Peregrinibacteria bacterium]
MWIFLQLFSVSLWGWINVLDSLLVRHFEKRPPVMMWYQSLFTVSLLLCFAAFFDVQTNWAVLLALGGFISYLGDNVFFYTLNRIDVSVTNVAWSLLAVFLSTLGIVYLHESWSGQQWLGALLVFFGVLALSLWHRTIGRPRDLLLLPLLAALYVPYYFVQELALLRGESLFPVFFWPLFARELSAYTIGLCVSKIRVMVHSTPARFSPLFHVLNGAVIILFFTATYFTAKAYDVGPLSLVSVLGNVQPFFVLGFAGLVYVAMPRFAAKEILTMQSVGLKTVSFAAVFIGLALLGLAT